MYSIMVKLLPNSAKQVEAKARAMVRAHANGNNLPCKLTNNKRGGGERSKFPIDVSIARLCGTLVTQLWFIHIVTPLSPKQKWIAIGMLWNG
jgi:hypothetical protein